MFKLDWGSWRVRWWWWRRNLVAGATTTARTAAATAAGRAAAAILREIDFLLWKTLWVVTEKCTCFSFTSNVPRVQCSRVQKRKKFNLNCSFSSLFTVSSWRRPWPWQSTLSLTFWIGGRLSELKPNSEHVFSVTSNRVQVSIAVFRFDCWPGPWPFAWHSSFGLWK